MSVRSKSQAKKTAITVVIAVPPAAKTSVA